MYLSDKTVALIKDRADIEEVVSDYIPLKRRGSNLWAPCPFHTERTPSFSVSVRHGFYKCFGCGRSGDAISFVREMENCGYVEALEWLARKYSIQIERIAKTLTDEEADADKKKERLSHLLAFAKTRYAEQLKEHDDAKEARLYCEQRGLSKQMIETFGLGYGLDHWTAFKDAALHLGYTQKDLVEAGLLIVKEDAKAYDRFRARLLFPIHNAVGRVVGFGGRLIKKDTKEIAKYINSPETPLYTKGEHLYGIHEARAAIRRHEQVYVVEGYMDVLAMHAAGFTHTVGVMGTALTEAQVRLLARYTKQVTLLLDGDAAGRMATFRSIDLLLAEGLKVYVMPLADQEDPDSCLRDEGVKTFGERLQAETQSFLDYEATLLLGEAGKDAMQQAEVLERVLNSVACVKDEAQRQLLLNQCKAHFNLDEAILLKTFSKVITQQSKQKPKEFKEEKARHTSRILHKHEYDVLYHLIHYGDFKLAKSGGGQCLCAEYILEELEGLLFYEPSYMGVLRAAQAELKRGDFDIKHLSKYSDEPTQKVIADLVFRKEKYRISAHWQEETGIATDDIHDWRAQVHKSLLRYKYRWIRMRLKLLYGRIADSEEAKLAYIRLKAQEVELSRELGIGVQESVE